MKKNWEATHDVEKLNRLAAEARKEGKNQPLALTKLWEFAGGDESLHEFVEHGRTFNDAIDRAVRRAKRRA